MSSTPTKNISSVTTPDMLDSRLQVGWSLWIQWIIANGLGFVVGLVLSPIILYIAIPVVRIGILFGAFWGVIGATMGGVIGIAQRFVLQRHGYRFKKWILVSSLGGAIGLALTSFFWLTAFQLSGSSFASATISVNPLVGWASFVFVGTSAGLAQWLVLRHVVRRAGLWILANALGWIVGPALMQVLHIDLLYGAGAGAITGSALVWLLRYTAEKAL